MTNTSTHHAFCSTLFTLVALAFGVAFTSSLASKPSLRNSALSVVTPAQEQASPAKAQTPSVTPPCPAGPAPIQVAL